MKIELTAGARRKAEETGLTRRLAALRLGMPPAVGDLVELTGANGQSGVFIVYRRRLVIGDGDEPHYIVTLDHPARTRGR